MRRMVGFLFLMFAVFSPPYFQVQAESSPQVLSERLDRLMTQADAIQKQQEKILSQQDATLAEIENLKIQVRR